MTRSALLLALVLSGCRGGGGSDPAEAWRLLTAAVARTDPDAAWEQLSAPTRARLDQAAKASAEARGRPAPADGRLFAFVSGRELPAKATKVETESVSGDRAKVRVTDETGRVQVLSAVLEDGRWKADLTAELDEATK